MGVIGAGLRPIKRHAALVAGAQRIALHQVDVAPEDALAELARLQLAIEENHVCVRQAALLPDEQLRDVRPVSRLRNTWLESAHVALGTCRREGEAAVGLLEGTAEIDILINSSASLIKPLLAADLFDRLYLMIFPEIARGGQRLFDDGLPATKWTLAHQETGEPGERAMVYDRAR
ncbi:dihydrofolate reductase family protein [Streptomyces sp. MZ04]|uniref:dihydrofolate reductase family protein n=1 Tax=Streptomyces sp. MZ04 TaxID=2559236 RepID=UPI001FD736FA|nr:dihydrofolate reductase family protein [Streptomyces sp. MZ04]